MVSRKFNPKNKFKIYWDDTPENYSKASEGRIQAYFSKKYGLPKTNIKVVYRPIKRDVNGNVVEMNDAGVDNIMDVNYQRELMKQWLINNDVKVDSDRLFKLDDKVNKNLDFNINESRHRRWSVKSLWINNFLCFGEDNFINFGNLSGLNVVNSIPENTGGKTTFNVDTFKFLLFGKTTKTEKNEDIFNTYSENNELLVKGILHFFPDDIVIERKLVRKKKRDGGWSIKSTLKYYRVLPDGSYDEMDEEDATQTTKTIGDAIGKESDFDITTLATANNLESLIETKPTENGKLLNRFIGLEIIDDKLVVARQLNTDFNKTKVGNMYNVITLGDEIVELKDKFEMLTTLSESHGDSLIKTEAELVNLTEIKDLLLSQKQSVDESLLNVNTETLNDELEEVKNKGVQLKTKKGELVKAIADMGEVSFDEDEYDQLTNLKNDKNILVKNLDNEVVQANKRINSLENDQICPTCTRPLEDIDHTKEIENIKVRISEIGVEKVSTLETISQINEGIEKLSFAKANVDKKNQLELSSDKIDVELGSLRNKYTETNNRLTNYNKNKEVIDNNIELDIKVSDIKTKIKVQETTKASITEKMGNIKIELHSIEKDITTKEGYVSKIHSEAEVEKIFKVYTEMVGKKGISKMVLRSVLPIINSELLRLMDDICDFVIELNIDDKNDVDYLLIRDGVTKSLKSGSGLEKTISSIALRAVLGKMSYLPMPNFITFDEVLGKVANDNIEKMQSIFEKIKELYDVVFLITHNDIVKDWADRIITVKKVDNISELNIK